jgi:sortase A
MVIPKIELDAPITWSVKNTDAEVQSALKNGLVNLQGTSLPGEAGNVFITGHSSDLPWSNGNYKTIFSLLNKMVVGDIIMLKYQNKEFIYKVHEVKVVQPDDLSVLDQTNDSILTLMTCTPVGTTLRRLIVASKQIYPETNTLQVKQEGTTLNELPKVR